MQVRKPGPKQEVAAEPSRRWGVLENARPERMKGYGREFGTEDKADWYKLTDGLMYDIKEIRRESVTKSTKM